MSSSKFRICSFSAALLTPVAVAAAPALSQSAQWTAEGTSSGDRFGLSVATVGDVDGDGIDDAIVGSPNDDQAASDAGAAFVVSGLDGSVIHTILGAASGDSLGFSVSGAGDVDADGVPDVIAGARFADTAGSDFGQAVVVSGATGSTLYTLNGISSGGRFGEAVGAAGDVNGDGHADVIVGARLDDSSGSPTGRARVYSGFDGSILYDLQGDSAADFFGRSVGTAGDIDGDGLADFLVGAPGDDDAGASSGSVRVYSGLDGSVLHRFDGDLAGDQLGGKVAGGLDLDLDGTPDLIAGMIGSDLAGSDFGAARVYSGFDGSVLFTALGSSASSEFGSAVSLNEDMNGDGNPDVIVGARLDDGALGAQIGSATVLSGANGSTILRLEGPEVGSQFGDTATGIGDLNGDGHADLIVGAFGASGTVGSTGLAIAYAMDMSIGTAICSPAVPNSTGLPATLTAEGSLDVTANDVRFSVAGLAGPVERHLRHVGPAGSRRRTRRLRWQPVHRESIHRPVPGQHPPGRHERHRQHGDRPHECPAAGRDPGGHAR